MLPKASEQNFSNFRRQFYQTNRDSIKFSLKGHPHIKITNIRLAHVNESVQKDFMKTFKKESSHSPQLVYHGTKSDNIGSILQYGFLIPVIPHATNTKAPTIKVINCARLWYRSLFQLYS
ncbi:unnamed protein product [Rotaria sp. Silwood2]|nr:unnamed protein product [Rotaria sp. Silwood2]CAF4495545.1 unnamed protein product [Rotaria sp. Silwood2]